MKNSKVKGLLVATAILASPLLVSTHAFAATSSFTDINNSFSQDAISKLADAGILHGSSGSFNPRDNVTRQDFAIIITKALKLDISQPPTEATFSDVPSTSYAFPYVEAAVKAGLITGYNDGSFKGSDNISRQDMATLLVRSLNSDDNGSLSSYAKDAVGYAGEVGLIHHGQTNGAFDPQGNATREQVAETANTFIQAQKPSTIPTPSPVQNHAPVVNTIGQK